MKFAREIDCACSLRAQLSEDGTFVLRTSSRAEYEPGKVAGLPGNRVPVPPEIAGRVEQAMVDALNAVHEALAREVDHSVYVNRERDRQGYDPDFTGAGAGPVSVDLGGSL